MERFQSNGTSMPKSLSAFRRRKRLLPQRQISHEIDYGDEEENGIIDEKSEIPADTITLPIKYEESKSPASEIANVENIDEHVGLSVDGQQQPTPQNLCHFLNLMNNPFLSQITKTQLAQFLNVQQQFLINKEDSEAYNISSGFGNEMINTVSASLSQFHQGDLLQIVKDEIEKLIDNIILGYCSDESRAFMERMLQSIISINNVRENQEINDEIKQQQQQTFAALAFLMMAKIVNSMCASNGSINEGELSTSIDNSAVTESSNGITTVSLISSNSIFPASSQSSLSSFPNLLSLLNNANQLPQNYSIPIIDCSQIPKKRPRISDCLKTKKPEIAQNSNESKNPFKTNNFSPTMVKNDLSFNFVNIGENFENNNSNIKTESFNDHSINEDDDDICLTTMHLRKAKQIFLYSRYPTLELLELYFHDIPFNNRNKKQLVKWYSNFREYFFLQIEKYAKKAIGNGILHSDEIHITEESDVFKAINQRFNRYNVFKSPPSLCKVIEESMKEFFDALQLRLDFTPSWKKPIYKIIRQMDDPIPEYLKQPNFMPSIE